jgi:D-glycero-D-manno-heptose 1,7-bisphosphate phosphatase
MLLAAAAEFDIDLSQSWMVGDRWRDVGAGKAAGTKTMFIDYNYKEQRPVPPDHTAKSLADAADYILACTARDSAPADR